MENDENPIECADPKNIDSGLIAGSLPFLLRAMQSCKYGYDRGFINDA